MGKWVLFYALLSIMANGYGQSPKYRVLSIPVENTNAELREPWAGGMNAPQFSQADINHDGIKDLFVFDRSGNRVMVYLGNGNGSGSDTAYVYSPKYEALFPGWMNDWALLRDYNGDTIPDIFTRTNLGTIVFKGEIVDERLQFDTVCALLKYQSGQFNVNIWTSSTDLPLFGDVNGDGDVDVLSYGVFGTTISYYENQAKEHPGDVNYSVDSFRYDEVTQCWGHAAQNSLNNSMVLNVTCKGNLSAPTDGSHRHAGNSLYGFDAEHDGDMDVLNGNIGYSNLAFLKNCGNTTTAHICVWDSLFPSCNSPILLSTYPAAYAFDAEGDEWDDLLVAPNAAVGANDVKNVQFYRNTGDTSCPFELVTDSFLVQHMLDFGADSKPVFHDMNGDGLTDIIIGNYGYFREGHEFSSSLAYLENTGTPTFARFQLVTADYDSISKFNLVAMHPAFGDLDGDRRDDMVMGEVQGYLHYFRNTSFSGSSFPAMTTPQYFNIKVNQFSAPYIYDVNGDSLNDLLVGRDDGKVSYYWNYGTKTNPLFSTDSVNSNFGFVNVKPYGFSFGYSQPVVVKDSAGKDMLLVGSSGGTVYQYYMDHTKLRSDTFPLIDSNYLKQDVGMKAVLSVADLNSDGRLEYVMGNTAGGLTMYSDSLWDSATLPFNHVPEPDAVNHLHIFPNPSTDYFICELDRQISHKPYVEVFNLLGERVGIETDINGKRIKIQLSDVTNGFYWIRIRDGNKNYTGKVLILR